MINLTNKEINLIKIALEEYEENLPRLEESYKKSDMVNSIIENLNHAELHNYKY